MVNQFALIILIKDESIPYNNIQDILSHNISNLLFQKCPFLGLFSYRHPRPTFVSSDSYVST